MLSSSALHVDNNIFFLDKNTHYFVFSKMRDHVSGDTLPLINCMSSVTCALCNETFDLDVTSSNFPHRNSTCRHVFCTCDLDFDTMTFIYELDIQCESK